HAGEDLPAPGQVPVAERHRLHAWAGRPRTAAQHAVVLAEEHFGVLLVWVGDEARVPAERAAGPLPHSSHLCELYRCARLLLLPGRRPLPLRLAGKTRIVRAGEGVGLEPADMARRRLGPA